jgi:anti-sigma regulatory factor (Ser/Thr protein kinase)
MAIVELRFSALPEHVRTARLVAAAVARRAGITESMLDEVRLAVGEACSRAVGLHQEQPSPGGARDQEAGRADQAGPPVTVILDDGGGRFTIEVNDGVPHHPRPGGNGSGPWSGDGAAAELAEGELGLAVILGLVDELDVHADEKGGVIRMSWPAVAAAGRTID